MKEVTLQEAVDAISVVFKPLQDLTKEEKAMRTRVRHLNLDRTQKPGGLRMRVDFEVFYDRYRLPEDLD